MNQKVEPLADKDWLQQFATSAVVGLIAAILARALNVISWPFSILDPWLSGVIIITIVFFFPKLNIYMRPAGWIRRWLFRSRFKNPRVGILDGYVRSQTNETRCETGFTSFSPQDWRDHFEHRLDGNRRYRVDLIPAKDIGTRFSLIINPFGELYPEGDLIELTTFMAIKRFIYRGGSLFTREEFHSIGAGM